MTFEEYIRYAMRLGALKKQAENEAARALDERPFVRPARGPWCSNYGAGPKDPAVEAAYRASLAQLGLELLDDGRMRVLSVPPCGHRPGERNTGRDQLTCDGCRRSR